MPIAKAEVVNVATPPLSVPVPIGLPPSRNVTVPIGVPAPGATGETVVLKVTDWPNTVGLVEEVRVTAELAWLTVWVRVAERLVLKLFIPGCRVTVSLSAITPLGNGWPSPGLPAGNSSPSRV